MASTTIRPSWLFLLLGCKDSDKPPADDKDFTLSTAETGDTATSPTGDTSVLPIDVWPLCDHVGYTEPITLLGADPFDYLGHSVDAADTDGDGCFEVAVAATWNFGGYEQGEGAVYLVTADGLASGDIHDAADVIWQENGEDSWVYRVALVGSQIIWLTVWQERTDEILTTFNVIAYHLPEAPLKTTSVAADRTGDLYIPIGYSINASNDIEDCSGVGQPTFCVNTASRGPENDFAGAIWLFDAPLQESRSFLDFRARISGEDGESARVIEADDLDNDGLDDLIIGAFAAAGTGRVGLVSAPPDGDHLLWDVAYATLDGVVEGAEAGLGLATGDLDGDGHVDVFVGAPIEDGGYAYVAMGPFSGSRSLADAAYTVTGDIDGQWTGYDGAIGDMDGDGQAELIVGAPFSIYFNTEPGTVARFEAPTPGSYLVSDADTTLTSGSPGPDAFGLSIAPGDIDGDGRMDLAIGAPDDARSGALAGSITLVFGASL